MSVESLWGSTVHHLNDLPYDPKEGWMPHVYGKYREKNAGVKVRDMVDTPQNGELPFVGKTADKVIKSATSFVPTLKDFGFEEEHKADKRACYDFKGGEDAGLARVTEYIHSRKSVGKYFETRNQLIGSEYSSKFSPWLANGCISPRDIYFQTKAYEKQYESNQSTTVFIDELLWRDFYRIYCMKNGNKIFSEYGIYDRKYYNW